MGGGPVEDCVMNLAHEVEIDTAECDIVIVLVVRG